jgi:hypothetical protein
VEAGVDGKEEVAVEVDEVEKEEVKEGGASVFMSSQSN